MDRVVYDLRLPADWYPLADERQERGNLGVVWDYAAQLPEGQRWNFVRLDHADGDEASTLLSLRLSRIEPTALEQYRVLVQQADRSTEAVEVLNRSVTEALLPSGVAIVTHDITVGRDQDGMQRPAFERVGVALFIQDAPALAEFLLVTQNLALYPAMVESALELVSGYVRTETAVPA